MTIGGCVIREILKHVPMDGPGRGRPPSPWPVERRATGLPDPDRRVLVFSGKARWLTRGAAFEQTTLTLTRYRVGDPAGGALSPPRPKLAQRGAPPPPQPSRATQPFQEASHEE